uniref:Uncharacterized protein n=1 Tax=Anguilla anguilla TaxID=7936 RepID=A0A0E9SEC7_ANGAN
MHLQNSCKEYIPFNSFMLFSVKFGLAGSLQARCQPVHLIHYLILVENLPQK